MTNGHSTWRVFLAVAVVCALAAAAQACPSCKDNLDAAANGGGAARGFYYSILAMVTAPYLAAGGIGWGIWRAVRRREAAAV